MRERAPIYQHPRSPVRFDPRDPPAVDPYPAPSVIEKAKAAQLCERADALDAAPEDARAALLRVMDKPSYLELQAEESRDIEHIAETAATRLYGRSLDMLDRPTQAKLRDNAAIFVRSCREPWIKYARNMATMAVEGLLKEDLHRALPHLNADHWYGHAVRCVGTVWGAMRSNLASLNGIAPGLYLRIHAQCIDADAERKR